MPHLHLSVILKTTVIVMVMRILRPQLFHISLILPAQCILHSYHLMAAMHPSYLPPHRSYASFIPITSWQLCILHSCHLMVAILKNIDLILTLKPLQTSSLFSQEIINTPLQCGIILNDLLSLFG